MKLYVYKGLTHGISFYSVEQSYSEANFLGTIEVTEPGKEKTTDARELALKIHEKLWPNAHCVDCSFIDKVESIIKPSLLKPGTHKASEVVWGDDTIEWYRLKRKDMNTYHLGFRFAESLFREQAEPKKTVTKEAEENCPPFNRDFQWKTHHFHIPVNAKNIRCTYEVKE